MNKDNKNRTIDDIMFSEISTTTAGMYYHTPYAFSPDPTKINKATEYLINKYNYQIITKKQKDNGYKWE